MILKAPSSPDASRRTKSALYGVGMGVCLTLLNSPLKTVYLHGYYLEKRRKLRCYVLGVGCVSDNTSYLAKENIFLILKDYVDERIKKGRKPLLSILIRSAFR